jgi:ATP-dependent Clp protease ATP-binding subunit ClpB
LVGAPPGYVGYEEGGQLTEAVRRKPYTVVLLDEIEKAHPDVFNILLQLLDDGRLTDSQGRTVDFKNTVIIMTSNIGSALLVEAAPRGETGSAAEAGSRGEAGSFEEASDRVRSLLRDHFRPEFLNRVDEIIIFRPLDREQLSAIVGLLIGQMESRLAEAGLSLSISDAALGLVAEAGYDPTYGARPLRRALQRLVENPLARRVLAGDFVRGETVRIDAADGELTFAKAPASASEPAAEPAAAG